MKRGIIYGRDGGLGEIGGSFTARAYFEQIGCQWSPGARPVFVPFRGDIYCIGYHTRPVMQHKRGGRWYECGIRPPTEKVAVAVGGGTGGGEGLALCYITGLHKLGGAVLAESSPSNVVNVGELAGHGRSWSNIQASGWDTRVTHVRGYCSMDGAEFRQAWEARVGMTSVFENVSTARLSNTGPGWTHGIPPATRYAHPWQGRMWYANSSQYPYRLWRSEPGYPQYVQNASFLDTLDREPITGLWRGRGEMLVFCHRGSYMVREAAVGTYVMERLDSVIGCINFFGIQEIENVVWFPSEETYRQYNGQFLDAMPDIRALWAADYKANREAFLNGFSTVDLAKRAFIFVTERDGTKEWEQTGLSPKTVAYVGSYVNRDAPELASPTPDWSIDIRARKDTAACFTLDGTVLFGDELGVIRAEDPLNSDDDGDTFGKPWIAEHGHRLLAPGGDWTSGIEVQQFWAHVESENNPWRLEVVGGGEWACLQMRPDNTDVFWKVDVPSSIQAGVVGTSTYLFAPETSHFFIPQRVSGKGFTPRIYAANAVGLRYRGYGFQFSPGQAPRGPVGSLGHDATGDLELTLEWFDVGDSTWKPVGGGSVYPPLGPLQLRISAANGTTGTFTLPAVAAWYWSGIATGGTTEFAEVGGAMPFDAVTISIRTTGGEASLVVVVAVRDSQGNYATLSKTFGVGHPV